MGFWKVVSPLLFMAACQQEIQQSSVQSSADNTFGDRLPLVSKTFKPVDPSPDDVSCALESLQKQNSSKTPVSIVPESKIPKVYSYLNQLVERIHLAAKQMEPQGLPNKPPKVFVTDLAEPNAYAFGSLKRSNGKCLGNSGKQQWAVYLNIGLFKDVSSTYSDAEFAFVIAHELSHLTRAASGRFRYMYDEESFGDLNRARSLTSVLKGLSSGSTSEDLHIISMSEFSDLETSYFLQSSKEPHSYLDFHSALFVSNSDECESAQPAAEALIKHVRSIAASLEGGGEADDSNSTETVFKNFRTASGACKATMFWDRYDVKPSIFTKGKRNIAVWKALENKESMKAQLDAFEQAMYEIQEGFDFSSIRTVESEADQLAAVIVSIAGFDIQKAFSEPKESNTPQAQNVPATTEVAPSKTQSPFSMRLSSNDFFIELKSLKSGYVYEAIDSHPQGVARNEYIEKMKLAYKQQSVDSTLKSNEKKRLQPSLGQQKTNGRYLTSQAETQTATNEALAECKKYEPQQESTSISEPVPVMKPNNGTLK